MTWRRSSTACRATSAFYADLPTLRISTGWTSPGDLKTDGFAEQSWPSDPVSVVRTRQRNRCGLITSQQPGPRARRPEIRAGTADGRPPARFTVWRPGPRRRAAAAPAIAGRGGGGRHLARVVTEYPGRVPQRPPGPAKAIGAEVRRGTYDVVVDGERAGSVEMNHTIEIPVEPGRHTLQVRNGRNSSSTQTFDAAEEEIVAFRCTGNRPSTRRLILDRQRDQDWDCNQASLDEAAGRRGRLQAAGALTAQRRDLVRRWPPSGPHWPAILTCQPRSVWPKTAAARLPASSAPSWDCGKRRRQRTEASQSPVSRRAAVCARYGRSS